MRTWSVYEFSRLYKSNITKCEGDHLNLEHSQFEALKQLLTCSEADHDKLFRYGFEKRQEVLVCQNYVGVICLPCGDQIEILPKTHRKSIHAESDESISRNRSNLIKMLKATQYLPGKVADNASLDMAKMPLLDVFIQLFLQEVSLLIKRGVARQYETHESNEPFIKGRILASQQIRHNLVNKHHHFIAFDELTTNRPENRLIKSALLWSLKRVTAKTQHLCRELLFHFEDVTSSKAIWQDLNSWQRGRHLSHYEAIRPWIEMIFKDQSPTSVNGSKSMLSILFPMERVFEDYVPLCLKKQFKEKGYVINTQNRSKNLVKYGANNEKELFQLRPDLHIKAPDKLIIGDTKWKVIDENFPNKKYGISESDIYQMLAYNQTYQKGESEPPVIWLIYPMTPQFLSPLPDFIFDNGLTLKVLPFDIDKSELVDNTADN
ncbi:McrC family protein [Pseudoalteromonas sp. ACER1]|uniref:McrC family protein n=1 Tax=unclassified Pseudoalteromonas TaxID=194690 RepID=UPI001F2A6C80|nr:MULTISPECIES: McrC family protein [unclassified Pseudoalteromonas]MCF2850028.1 McrC family protein [Pseudoalteromonas sp. PAST1]MCO7213404.1 McrC family protein [Pseudoalteromonas sp. ACER1]